MAADTSNTARHTEVERKFDVLDATVSPSFDGLAAVARVVRIPAQTLDAVYYDTPGRDLAAHRITLRRRTGGSDAGWHLKLPAGPETRTEVRAALGEGDEVPFELRDVVLAIVRDRPLEAVARITTSRTVETLHDADGDALAEFADDQVSGWAEGADDVLHWREWELELSENAAGNDGARQLLDRLANRLLDAGAQPAGHGSKLARVLDGSTPAVPAPAVDDPVHRAVVEEVQNLLAWDRAVRADVYDSVHQMRVTTRKIRSLLQASESAFGLSDDAWILDELRQLASVLGLARDAEVLAERYEEAIGELPSELVRGPVHQRLVDGARRRYRSGWRKSLAAMRSQRYFRLLDALEGLVAAEPAPAADGEESSSDATVESGYRRVRKQAKRADKAEIEHRDEALHRIRKGAKRLRYTAAATGAKKVSEAAKTIQSLLGDHQDSVVSRTHLAQQAEAAHAAGEDTFTYGLLYEREAELARRCREELRPALKALAKAVGKQTS
ncbi:MAG: CYTH and CHAD domain-containing protein [Mycobacterium sp.]